MRLALDAECNPLQGPYVDKIIKRLHDGKSIERKEYVEKKYFDYFTITQEIIEGRGYRWGFFY